MGWQHDEHPDHEGYLVGFVTREGCSPEAGQYRELTYPADDVTREVGRLGAGCDCGWRSPRWLPSSKKPATWTPYSVSASEDDKERAFELWQRHLSLDVEIHDIGAPRAGHPTALNVRRARLPLL
jgi:hypothetical protein